MEITQQADYAVRAVLELAMLPAGERLFSKDIARRQGIPLAFLVKILARLSAAGIVRTQRGVNGGVRLARRPDQVSILDVVEAIDGPIQLNRCTRAPSECPRDAFCAVHGVWTTLQTEVRERLAGFDFASLASEASRQALPISACSDELPPVLPAGQQQ